jgi:hypothetical protein
MYLNEKWNAHTRTMTMCVYEKPEGHAFVALICFTLGPMRDSVMVTSTIQHASTPEAPIPYNLN